MLGGLYTAASGMEAQQQQMDALANDIANVSTSGYQSSRVGFHDLLYSSSGSASGSTVATGAGAASQVVGRSQTQGQIQLTGRTFDVAISGPGYIEVRRPDGTIGLTRNGGLQIDAQGRLTNQLGMLVQPPITVPAGVNPSDVKIDPSGNVSAGSQQLGQIQLVTVPNPDGLVGDGDSVLSATAASGTIRTATGATLQQGALEASNVDVSTAMVAMIDAQRAFSMGSKAVQFQDQMLQIANQVKR